MYRKYSNTLTDRDEAGVVQYIQQNQRQEYSSRRVNIKLNQENQRNKTKEEEGRRWDRGHYQNTVDLARMKYLQATSQDECEL